jgi:hypothetical protein
LLTRPDAIKWKAGEAFKKQFNYPDHGCTN